MKADKKKSINLLLSNQEHHNSPHLWTCSNKRNIFSKDQQIEITKAEINNKINICKMTRSSSGNKREIIIRISRGNRNKGLRMIFGIKKMRETYELNFILNKNK